MPIPLRLMNDASSLLARRRRPRQSGAKRDKSDAQAPGSRVGLLVLMEGERGERGRGRGWRGGGATRRTGGVKIAAKRQGCNTAAGHPQ